MITEDAAALADELTLLRHELHRFPELGLQLPKTQRRILQALEGLPLEVATGAGLTSVTAVLRGGRPGPVVLLRGDMDALPVAEQTDVSYRSENAGIMHACGHDTHVTMMVGAAKLLCARRDELAGSVVFMFQPGEEGDGGAQIMIDEGVLEAAGTRPVAAYGLHIGTMAPHAVFASRPGPLMAAVDDVSVRIVGAGGHGSTPHRGKDPIPVACEMVLALQTFVTRQFDIFDPVVITVGSMHGGTKNNIIPDEATLEITVRTFSDESHARMEADIPRLLEGIAAGHGLSAEVAYHLGYPATITDAAETAFVEATVGDLFGAQRWQTMQNPIPGAEDFSYVLQQVPGCFVFLGGGPAGVDPMTLPSNHSSTVEFVDSVLPDGAALLAELAIRRLAQGDG